MAAMEGRHEFDKEDEGGEEDGLMTASKMLKIASSMSEAQGFNIKPEFKRKDERGNLYHIDDKERGHLDTQMRLQQIGKMLAAFKDSEKLEWGLEMKEYGNKLFREQKYEEAMHKYLEAVMGTVPEEGGAAELVRRSRDELQVPALLNLAACGLRLRGWRRARAFCDQALALLPPTTEEEEGEEEEEEGRRRRRARARALRRRGQALLGLLEGAAAAADLRAAAALCRAEDEEELKIIRQLLARIRRHQLASKQATANQRDGMRRALQPSGGGGGAKEDDDRAKSRRRGSDAAAAAAGGRRLPSPVAGGGSNCSGGGGSVLGYAAAVQPQRCSRFADDDEEDGNEVDDRSNNNSNSKKGSVGDEGVKKKNRKSCSELKPLSSVVASFFFLLCKSAVALLTLTLGKLTEISWGARGFAAVGPAQAKEKEHMDDYYDDHQTPNKKNESKRKKDQ